MGGEGGIQMLATERNLGRLTTRNNDTIHETGKRRDTADDEGHHGAPVGGVVRGVAVDAVEVVHVWYGDVSSANNEVAEIVSAVCLHRRGWEGEGERMGTHSVIRIEVIGPRKIV